MKSLENAIAEAISRFEKSKSEATFGDKNKHMLGVASSCFNKLAMVLAEHRGDPSEAPRQPYENKVEKSIGFGTTVSEKHESFGLIQVNRTTSNRSRLFGSVANNPMFFTINVKRAVRKMDRSGERITDTGTGPNLVEIQLSAAQFVDMITNQNSGCGVPCTISRVNGIGMEPVPDSMVSEIDGIEDSMNRNLEDIVSNLSEKLAEVDDILGKKSIGKEDRARIRDVLFQGVRFLTDSVPYVSHTIGEVAENITARGRMEIEAFMQTAIHRAGIKSIKDADGHLLLGSGDE